jgi:hypothetical protein
MDNSKDKLIQPNLNLLTYVRRGVLYVQKVPHYIVELVKEENISYVVVYKVHPNTESNPQKLANEVKAQQHRFSNRTLLGQLANRIIPNKVTKKWEPKPPAFIAPVLPNVVSTFTGKEESGFFEREEDHEGVINGERRIIRGVNTGVAIGLSSITWEDKITIPTSSLVNALKQYQSQGGFYDFSGNNNDKSNPLSTYYTGGDRP